MRTSLVLLVIFSLAWRPLGYAQSNLEKYWVFFTDKEQGAFDPYAYFDQKAIERRVKSNIPINHPSDWPVTFSYVDSVAAVATKTSHASRWFNALSISATTNQVETIAAFEFVKAVEPMMVISYPASMVMAEKPTYKSSISTAEMKLLMKQTARMEADAFHDKNIRGQGLRIAIFDAGFPSVDVNPAFEHIRAANRIIKTYDFLSKKENVYKHSAHGCNVLSCIAGIINGQRIGLATEAEFLLARTESGMFEPFSEEENWLAAVEWADKNGADLINSSLGYTNNRYFTSDMDGKTSLVARAANMAARKGILVLNAAGNDGSDDWKYQGTPADADSVLSVGGIDFNTDFHISFSSFGPTSDKRMKPNICALGVAMVAGPKAMEKAYGTSFASPLATGFAACAWQTDREATNMEMFKKLEQSGEFYPYFDYAHGFGVPQASFFVNKSAEPVASTFEMNTSNFEVSIEIDKAQFDLEGEDAGAMLFYHIENTKGYLDKYYVIAVRTYNVLQLNKADFKKGSTLRVHFKGYTKSYTF
ncbi:MAG: S8 family serine peptidase [Flavobacteriales bacterium]|nr:S8 family serine peptidase [Flavobacteriales bacterium]